MIHALLVTDWCRICSENTEQELNSIALELECTECKNVDFITSTYATQMMED
jgi:cytochrome c-type biogenesis protein CcmH/NrfF